MGNNQNHQKNHKKGHQSITYAEMYKITIIGCKKSGKTSIINKYLEGKEFTKPSNSITIFDFPFEGRNIGVQICEYLITDLGAGSGLFGSRRTDIFIFVYDISDKATFVSIKRNITIYKDRFEEKGALIILVGNKLDFPRREVQRNLEEDLAKEYNAFLIELVQ